MHRGTISREEAIKEAARLTEAAGALHVVRVDYGVYTPCRHFLDNRYLEANPGNAVFGELIQESCVLIKMAVGRGE